MKALTLTQPWAHLVATGKKQLETRSWTTSYRGPLAIHAASNMPVEARAAVVGFIESGAIVKPALANNAWDWLPRGCVVATCELADVWRVPHDRMTEDAAIAREAPFGNFARGRYVWVLWNVKRLAQPIDARGALGLWEWDPKSRA